LPLIAHDSCDAVIAYRAGLPVSAREFLADVARVARALGPAGHILNACTDRYHFCVGLAASLTGGKVSLLPSTDTPEVTRQLAAFAPDVVCLTDEATCGIELPQVPYPHGTAALGRDGGTRQRFAAAVPQIDAMQRVAYVFTSGSTGAPLPHSKRWGNLTACVREEARRLGLSRSTPCAIVATVPPQHMYGFESSVLLPLCTGHALTAERPFFPADIVATLAAVPRPRLLVTTPVHLRALVASNITLPPVDLIVCSTAPLAQQLAIETEQRFAARVLEIYGSTETGQIASRYPTAGAEWTLWPGVTLSRHAEESWARGGHIEERTRLYDVLELTAHRTFLLHGRVTDLVNIAGKRSSLGYLNHQLNSIPGVEDGAFFHVEESRSSHTAVARVAACVVAPTLDSARLLQALRQRIDAVFLPRPLVFVERLPRNATGKLPQEALRALALAREVAV
jgi:acyl-coenzyme A synthetase/AMP-(fatty) acid ligase